MWPVAFNLFFIDKMYREHVYNSAPHVKLTGTYALNLTCSFQSVSRTTAIQSYPKQMHNNDSPLVYEGALQGLAANYFYQRNDGIFVNPSLCSITYIYMLIKHGQTVKGKASHFSENRTTCPIYKHCYEAKQSR